MKIILFYLALFSGCLLISYTNSLPQPPPKPPEASEPQVLIRIARVTKWIYTGDSAFEYEKNTGTAL